MRLTDRQIQTIHDTAEQMFGGGGMMDALWVQEAEARLDAYDRGELKAIPLAELPAKYGASGSLS